MIPNPNPKISTLTLTPTPTPTLTPTLTLRRTQATRDLPQARLDHRRAARAHQPGQLARPRIGLKALLDPNPTLILTLTLTRHLIKSALAFSLTLALYGPLLKAFDLPAGSPVFALSSVI